MITALIFVGIVIGIVYVDKAFRPKPVIVRRSSYTPTRILNDGTIVCEKEINTWR